MEIVFITGESGGEKYKIEKKKSQRNYCGALNPFIALQQFAIRNIVCGKFVRTTGEIE